MERSIFVTLYTYKPKVALNSGFSPLASENSLHHYNLNGYLLLELLRRCTCKATHAFSNFVERIRICLSYYLNLEYVCNTIRQGAWKVKKASQPPDLFSSLSGQTHPSSTEKNLN